MDRTPSFCEFLVQELYQALTVTLREKNSSFFCGRKGKGNIFKYVIAFCFSQQGLLAGETHLPEPNLLGCIRA